MKEEKTLQEIFNEFGNLTDTDMGCNDKGGQIHTYLPTYERLFKPFKNGCDFMEIGLALGHSVKLFDEYFENSNLTCVDVNVIFQYKSKRNNVELINADATKEEFLQTIKGKTFDVVIDDASHMTNDQIATFNLLKDKMNKGGVYVIEDILNLDGERQRFLDLHKNCEIVDMRENGRFDNALIIYYF